MYKLLRYFFGDEKAVYVRIAWKKFPRLIYQKGYYRRSFRSPGKRELYLPNQLDFLVNTIFQALLKSRRWKVDHEEGLEKAGPDHYPAVNLLIMYNLDWGSVTPEATNIITNECLYIYNHTLKTAGDVERTIRFVVGRLRFYDVQLPPSAKHRVKIDARGQGISLSTINLLKNRISQLYNNPKLLSVDIIL